MASHVVQFHGVLGSMLDAFDADYLKNWNST
jgi:hypothetical protein